MINPYHALPIDKGLALALPLGFYKSIPIEINEAQIEEARMEMLERK